MQVAAAIPICILDILYDTLAPQNLRALLARILEGRLAGHPSVFMRVFYFRSFLFVALCIPSALAQGTLDDYKRAESFLPWNIEKQVREADVVPHWIEGTHRFWYRMRTPQGSEVTMIDADRGTRESAYDRQRISEGLFQATDIKIQADQLNIETPELMEDGKSIKFDFNGITWTCDLKEYHCKKGEGHNGRREENATSPNGAWRAEVKDHNLWLIGVSTGQKVQLTRDGEQYNDYATPTPSLSTMVEQGTEDVQEPAAVFWSPDSTMLLTYRQDSRNTGRFTSVQNVPPVGLRPKAYTYPYPLPGEALAQATPILFDVVHQKEIDIDAAPIQEFFQGGPGFEWSKDSKRFYFEVNARAYQSTRLIEGDPQTGKTHTVIDEESKTYVDPGLTFRELIDDGAQILWTSERDGWNHIYLYDGHTGQLIRQVTKGAWLVRRIVHVDEKAHVVYFLASGREPNEDPYQTHLYRIGLDGTGLRLLTPEDADHTATVSPDGAFVVDTYSRPDLPTVSVLRRTDDGKVVMELEKSDISALLKTGWKYPERFHAKGRDGKTDIYALIWRPSNFDPSRKYPVIEQIYTGPQGFFVPKTFAAYRGSPQSTAELGFITVMIDGLGTGGRSRAFHDFSYKNLGDGGIDDHIAVLRAMAEKYPYMDLTRVGLYGGSAGGYDAAHAMLTHPDFYKVAVSMSGNHDHRLDKAWWTELWMGYPVGPEYEAQSNVTLAGHLKGHLLLIHGDIDDIVHPVETMRFVDALIKANKNFDMLIVPNQAHGERSNTYIIRRRWDYFVQNLLNVAPPADFELHKAPPTPRPNNGGR
jgi:dipeptidyl-peptidase 4